MFVTKTAAKQPLLLKRYENILLVMSQMILLDLRCIFFSCPQSNKPEVPSCDTLQCYHILVWFRSTINMTQIWNGAFYPRKSKKTPSQPLCTFPLVKVDSWSIFHVWYAAYTYFLFYLRTIIWSCVKKTAVRMLTVIRQQINTVVCYIIW